MLNDILQKIEDPTAFKEDIETFLTSRKILIDALSAKNDSEALRKLLNEDVSNLASLQELLIKTGENIANIKKVEQYDLE